MADIREFLFSNNATATLGADVAPGDTSISVASGKGALFPLPGPEQIFKVTVQNILTGAYEIMNCTSRVADALIVERAREGTTALSFTAAVSVVQVRITAETLEKLQEAGTDPGGGGGVTDHGALTGLADDDHFQYHNDARGDARYPPLTRNVSTQHSLTGGGDMSVNRVLNLVGDVVSPGNNMVYGTNGSGTRGWYAAAVTDHGLLSGLADDDHTQYHTDARGDARYAPIARLISTQHSLEGGGDLSSNRTLALVGDTASPGNNMIYGTNGAGTRGWYAQTAGVTDHGALTGLGDDDHTQYHTDARGDARYVPLTRQIITQHSFEGGGALSGDRTLHLVNDVASPGNSKLYGTNGAGARGWYNIPTVLTVHNQLTGLSSDDHTQYHNDARGDARYPPLARAITTQHSLTGGGDLSSNRTLALVGDVASPGNNMLYGTNGSGVRGWYAAGAGGVTDHGALTGLGDDDHTQYLTNGRGDARYPPLARNITTQFSLTGGGNLTADRTLNLVGDVITPGASMVYGTNGSGTRGWYASNSHVHAAADVTSGTFANARIAAGNVTQHQAALSIATSQLTGTLPDARVAASNVTQHQASLGAETVVASSIARRDVSGDLFARYINLSCPSNETPVTPGQFLITNNTDNYMRKVSTTYAQIALNISTGSTPQFGSLGVGTAASGTSGEIRATNNVTSFYSSDARLKHNVRRIENALDLLKQINGVRFDWTDDYLHAAGGEDGYFVRRADVGVIAQEVEAILPEIVGTRHDGIKALKYERLVALLIEAVKELAAR